MGAAQSIPVVGEIVTVVDAGARTIAAGVCEVIGDSEDAGKLIQGAGDSLKHYTDVNLIVANTRVVIAKADGDEKTADYLLDKEKEAWTEVAENTPVVGLVRYAEGDQAGGDRAMMAATRSTLVAGAAILTGGAAAVPVAALTGFAADGLMTAANSAGKREFAPVGTFASIAQAAKSGSVNDWVSAVEIPVGDAVAGALVGGVKTISGSNSGSLLAYNNVSSDLAKILFDRGHQQVISTYGGSQWTTQCQDHVHKLPALDETAPLDAAPWVVAWHQSDSVRAIGFQTAESAQAMYDAISTDWAKVLGDKERSQISKSYGWECVAPCKEAVSLLNNLGDAVLVQHAPYVIALHQDDHVRVIGFSKEETGRVFYNAASHEWARIFFDRRRSQVLLSYGGDQWIECCKAQVLQLPSLQEADLPYGPYLVAFHQMDRVRTIALATEGSARAVYDAISEDWAKSLIDRRRDASLASYGTDPYIQKCREAALELNRLQTTVPLHSAQFVVAYHHNDRARLIGFNQQTAAQGVYNAISNDWAKIVTNRRDTMPLESSGLAYYIKQCEDEVQRLVSLDASLMPM